jgi:hypothetical protein
MKWTGLLAVVLAVVGSIGAPLRAAGESDAQIMITMRMFQLKADAVAEDGRARVPLLEDLPLVGAPEGDAVRVAVAGEEVDRFAQREAKHCISAPRIFTRSGQSGSIQIGREIACESMQPTAEPGVFRLVRGEPKFEGMRFDVLAEAGSDGSVEIRKLSMKFDQMVGREKVEGTELEVGAPIMKSRESTHALGLRAGQRALLSTPALDGSGETLLVVLEAAVVENPGEKAVPYTKDGGGR